MAIEVINPRTVAVNKETIGTLVCTATVERKDGKVLKITNGTVTENDMHCANFSLEENSHLSFNIPMYTQDKMVAVCAALPAFINNIMIAE